MVALGVADPGDDEVERLLVNVLLVPPKSGSSLVGAEDALKGSTYIYIIL